MRDIFVGLLILMVIVSFFSGFLTLLKAKLDKDAILYKKADNYIISIFVSLLVSCIGVEINNNIIYIFMLLLSISVYICVLLYNIKWNNYEADWKSFVEKDYLRDCTNFTEEDFVKFKEDMSRAEQIRWLKSLTWIYEEKIIPLIEDDEDLEDFECFLKKDK